MNITINNKKLKIKYILGNYRDLDTWPTAEDIMYLLVQWAMSTNSDDSSFSDSGLEKKLGINKDKLKEILIELEKEGYIVKEKSTNTKDIYRISKSPFV